MSRTWYAIVALLLALLTGCGTASGINAGTPREARAVSCGDVARVAQAIADADKAPTPGARARGMREYGLDSHDLQQVADVRTALADRQAQCAGNAPAPVATPTASSTPTSTPTSSPTPIVTPSPTSTVSSWDGTKPTGWDAIVASHPDELPATIDNAASSLDFNWEQAKNQFAPKKVDARVIVLVKESVRNQDARSKMGVDNGVHVVNASSCTIVGGSTVPKGMFVMLSRLADNGTLQPSAGITTKFEPVTCEGVVEQGS